MYIESIEVADFGTLDELEVEFDDGLNVLSGPTEAGKSTLMRAAWLGLMWPCRSQSEEIRSIIPNRGGTPTVQVVLVDDGTTYAMKKTFNQSAGSAHLRVRQPDGSVRDHRDDDAEEKLREAIGVGELSGRPKSPAHYGFWPAVWTRQDERHLDPGKHLTEKGSRESLSGILAQIGGDVLAGSGAEVVEQAEEEYGRFYTSSGNLTTRSGAPLHEAEKRRDELQEQFGQLRETRQNYEDDLDEFARLEREIQELQEDIPDLRAAAEDAAREYERVESLQGDLEQETTRLESKNTKVEQLEDRVQQRADLRENIETFEAEIEEWTGRIDEKQSVLDAHAKTREDLEAKKAEAEEERDRQKQRERLLQAHLEVLRAEDQLEGIADRSDRYDDLTAEQEELRARREGLTVTDDDVEHLRDLKERRDEASMRLEAAAARVSVEGTSDRDIRIGDAPVALPEESGREHLVDSRTTVHVGSDLRIHVEPGGKNLGEIRSEAEQAEDAYQDALADLGVDSVDAARSRVQEKERIDDRLETIASEIDRLLPEGSGDLDDARTRAEARLEAARSERAKRPAGQDVASLPEEEDAAREQVSQAREDLEAAQEALSEAREELQSHEDTAQELREAVQRLRTQKEGKEESLENVQNDLDRHVREHGADEELQEALDEARSDRDEKQEEVKRLRAELEDLDVDSIESRKQRTEKALESAEADKDQLQETLNKVEGRLEREELHGLHERLQKARQKLEDAQADVDRLQKQADAAKLLYETLTEKRAEARKRYLAPLREEVEGLLGRFFDAEESTVAFDEDLALEKLSRSTDGSFDFDQLSAGARQQLSLLIRLAMARLVARERPHPVFFDDVLSDTDPDRFEVIGDILHSVSQDMQIILTTCHRSRHRRLGAHNLRMEALKKGG